MKTFEDFLAWARGDATRAVEDAEVVDDTVETEEVVDTAPETEEAVEENTEVEEGAGVEVVEEALADDATALLHAEIERLTLALADAERDREVLRSQIATHKPGGAFDVSLLSNPLVATEAEQAAEDFFTKYDHN